MDAAGYRALKQPASPLSALSRTLTTVPTKYLRRSAAQWYCTVAEYVHKFQRATVPRLSGPGRRAGCR